MSEITHLLEKIEEGDSQASEQLLPLLYAELRVLADRQMNRERVDHTLSPTALVHEAYLRLVGKTTVNWQSQAHFFGAAARAMRRILIDHARRRNSAKRDGNRQRMDIEDPGVVAAAETRSIGGDDLLELDRALIALEKTDPEAAELVNLRFFAGLTSAQAAKQLGISARTADFRWAYARAWLKRFLSDS